MTTDHVAQPWALRSTLVAVADLDRSIGFYGSSVLLEWSLARMPSPSLVTHLRDPSRLSCVKRGACIKCAMGNNLWASGR